MCLMLFFSLSLRFCWVFFLVLLLMWWWRLCRLSMAIRCWLSGLLLLLMSRVRIIRWMFLLVCLCVRGVRFMVGLRCWGWIYFSLLRWSSWWVGGCCLYWWRMM